VLRRISDFRSSTQRKSIGNFANRYRVPMVSQAGQRINPLSQRCYRRISHRSDGSPEASAVFQIVVYCGLFLLKTVLMLFSLVTAAKTAILLVLFVPASTWTTS
jgi:hypothetical protein